MQTNGGRPGTRFAMARGKRVSVYNGQRTVGIFCKSGTGASNSRVSSCKNYPQSAPITDLFREGQSAWKMEREMPVDFSYLKIR